MAKFRFSRRAETDLLDIGEYTLPKWGEAQTARYIDELDDLWRKLLEAHDRGDGSLRELARRFDVSVPYAWKPVMRTPSSGARRCWRTRPVCDATSADKSESYLRIWADFFWNSGLNRRLDGLRFSTIGRGHPPTPVAATLVPLSDVAKIRDSCPITRVWRRASVATQVL